MFNYFDWYIGIDAKRSFCWIAWIMTNRPSITQLAITIPTPAPNTIRQNTARSISTTRRLRSNQTRTSDKLFDRNSVLSQNHTARVHKLCFANSRDIRMMIIMKIKVANGENCTNRAFAHDVFVGRNLTILTFAVAAWCQIQASSPSNMTPCLFPVVYI